MPRKGERAIPGYKENVIVDRGGFILARGIGYADKSDTWLGGPLWDELPLHANSLTADTGYSAGSFCTKLKERIITAFIPLHPKQLSSALGRDGFAYDGKQVICPEGKILKSTSAGQSEESLVFVAKQADCQACPRKANCLPAKGKRKRQMLSLI